MKLDAFDFAADILNPKSAVEWTPLSHQVPPPGLGYTLAGWLLMGGRGSGKTATCAKYVHDHVHGPPCIPGARGGHWISIVAPTLGDAVTSCVEGPSGLQLHDPGCKVLNRPGGLVAQWTNGVEAKLFGASTPEDVERFRAGGNRCLVWIEEWAAWRYLSEAFEQIEFGLRSGSHPHWVASTTPKNRPLFKKLRLRDDIVITHATTKDNPHLNERVREKLYETYEHTRLGRQELAGELLEDVEGALWDGDTIEAYRVTADYCPEWYDRIVIGVDPAAKSTEGSDNTGIVVVGWVKSWDHPLAAHPERSHAFVLEDLSARLSPTMWARRVVKAYRQHDADMVVAEINNGGEMVIHTIKTVDESVACKDVTATRGKKKRAEPVASLYKEGRVHHVGMFQELEDEMTGWDPLDEDESWSPDRMDALVWAITELMVGRGTVSTTQANDARLMNRR